MYKQKFEFTSYPLVLTTKEILPHNLLMDIFEFIQFIKYDFNQDIHNSSAYLFNATPVETPTLTNDKFTYYLNKNLEIVELTKNYFNPFYSKEKISADIDPLTNIEIDGDAFIKMADILFNTKPLLEPFAIDTIHTMLRVAGLATFRLESRHYIRAAGKHKWPVKYEFEDKHFHNTFFNEGTIYFHFIKDPIPETPNAYNVDTSGIFEPKLIIVESESAIGAKAIGSMTKDLYTSKMFEDFCIKNMMNLIVYDKQNKSHTFKYTKKNY